MTVSIASDLVFIDQGDGVTTQFSYPVKFLEASELVVFSREDGVDTTLVRDTHYTVAGAGVDGGGTITMLYVPSASEEIGRYRATGAKQIVNLMDGVRNPSEAVEGQMDRLAMVAQDNAERIARTVKVAPGIDGLKAIPLPEAGMPILGNDDEDGFRYGTETYDGLRARVDATEGANEGQDDRLDLIEPALNRAWKSPSGSGGQITAGTVGQVPVFDGDGNIIPVASPTERSLTTLKVITDDHDLGPVERGVSLRDDVVASKTVTIPAGMDIGRAVILHNDTPIMEAEEDEALLYVTIEGQAEAIDGAPDGIGYLRPQTKHTLQKMEDGVWRIVVPETIYRMGDALAIYDTRAMAEAGRVAASVNRVLCNFYDSNYTPASSGYYRRTDLTTYNTYPAAIRFQSADGAYWVIDGPRITLRACGAVGNGIADDTVATRAAATWITTVPNRTVMAEAGVYRLTDEVVMSATYMDGFFSFLGEGPYATRFLVDFNGCDKKVFDLSANRSGAGQQFRSISLNNFSIYPSDDVTSQPIYVDAGPSTNLDLSRTWFTGVRTSDASNTLIRAANAYNFRWDNVRFAGGGNNRPYKPIPTGVTFSITNGDNTLMASDDIFEASDVGKKIFVGSGSTVGEFHEIASYTSPTSVETVAAHANSTITDGNAMFDMVRCSTTASDNTVTLAHGVAVAEDVGRWVVIAGAGATLSGSAIGSRVAQITAVNSATSIEVAPAPAKTVSGQYIIFSPAILLDGTAEAGIDDCAITGMQLESFNGCGLYAGRGQKLNITQSKVHANNPGPQWSEVCSHVSVIWENDGMYSGTIEGTAANDKGAVWLTGIRRGAIFNDLYINKVSRVPFFWQDYCGTMTLNRAYDVRATSLNTSDLALGLTNLGSAPGQGLSINGGTTTLAGANLLSGTQIVNASNSVGNSAVFIANGAVHTITMPADCYGAALTVFGNTLTLGAQLHFFSPPAGPAGARITAQTDTLWNFEAANTILTGATGTDTKLNISANRTSSTAPWTIYIENRTGAGRSLKYQMFRW